MSTLARRRGLIFGLLFVVFTSARLSARENAPRYAIKVVTDRNDAIYETNQKARFLVSVTKNGEPVTEGKISYVVDDFIGGGGDSSFPKGTLSLGDKDAEVTATSSSPLFLRCRVVFKTPEGKTIQAIAGAGFSPTKIPLSMPVPDDFDGFWALQKSKLAKYPSNPELTPVASNRPGLEAFDVKVMCLGGAPVSGYFAKPKNAKPASLPAILWVHGAGVRSSSLGAALKGADAGMLSMDLNAHGIPNGKPAEFYGKLSRGKLKNYRQAGRESRETVYFRGMFLRLVRAIDFLTSQPEWDGQTVAVIGHSQGGGQALVAGGIDQRVTFIASGVPAICDHSGRAAGRINGWPKIVPNADGKPDQKILDACRYVDAVNFASRCKADAIMSVGFIDAVCPPSSCYAAYNALKGKKQIINQPLMGHAAPADVQKAFFDAIKQHVKNRRKTDG